MSAVNRIRAAGLDLREIDGRLLVRGTVTDEQRRWLSDHKAELLAELRTAHRPIVEYRFTDDSTWHVMLGRGGETFESAAAACRRQFGADVLTRERDSLPTAFPFKRHDEDGDWKAADGSELRTV